jgi:hypothetical protein
MVAVLAEAGFALLDIGHRENIMAHFAELNNNVVLRVLVVPNEQEHRGQEFLADDLGLGGTWIQTSYNATIRGKFAGVGDTYDSVNDVFVAPEVTEPTE